MGTARNRHKGVCPRGPVRITGAGKFDPAGFWPGQIPLMLLAGWGKPPNFTFLQFSARSFPSTSDVFQRELDMIGFKTRSREAIKEGDSSWSGPPLSQKAA